jgi:hypothetical protein
LDANRLFGLHRYFQTRRPRWLALFVIAYVLQVTSNMYAAYLLAIPAAGVIAEGVVANRARWRTMALEIVVAAIVVLLTLVPVLVPYYQARVAYRNVRNSVEIKMYSADVRSYFSPHESVGIWRWLPSAAAVEAEKALFPEFCSSRSDALPRFTRDVSPARIGGPSGFTERLPP